MVERGLRLLVKTNRAATTGRFMLGSAPVDLKLTPLMPNIDRSTGTLMAAAPTWHPAETETHLNPWDACHALLDQGLGVAGGGVVSAEPDLQQSWLWTTPNRQALAITGCDAAPPNHDVYATGNSNLWFVDDDHSQLEKTRSLRRCTRSHDVAPQRGSYRPSGYRLRRQSCHQATFPEQGPCPQFRR